MQELRQSTEIKVRIGSAVDATDGVTPETGLTLGAADQAELLKHNGAATVDISASTFAAVTAVDGWYDLTLTAGNTDTLGQLTAVIQDSSLMAPIFRDFMVVTANYWDSKYSTDKLQVDVTQLLGTAWLTPGVAGTPDVNAKLIGATAQTGRDIGASVLLSTGTGAGQLDFTSGIVKSNLTQILAHLLTQTGTQLADGFEHFFDVATPTGTLDSLPAAAPNAAGGLPISAAGGLDLDTKLANTNEITAARMGALTDWINGGRLDLIIDLILADTAELQGNQAAWATATGFSTHSAADIWSVATRALTDKSGFALSATGANLILKDSTFALAMADAIWDEILSGATHNIASSAGRRVREIGAYAIDSGTAQAGNSHSITLAATASAIDGTYNRNLIVLVDNTGVGQTRTIVDYDGTTKIAVIDRDWRTSPDATTTYQVTPDNTPLVVDQGIAQAGTATTITLRAYASAVNDTYLCNVVAIIAGTGRGQARLVGAYNGTTKVATICGDNWITNPDATSVYVLMPYGTTCTSCIGTYALELINTEVKDCLTVDTIADSYATDGNQPTIAQALLAIHQMLQEKSIAGTTLSVKKPDGSTVAMTFTLDSDTAPTSITRAT